MDAALFLIVLVDGGGSRSLRAIGRDISLEIEMYSEAKVKPNTITVKAHRMQQEGVTNVTPAETPTSSGQTRKSNEIKRAKDGKLRGGPREGVVLVAL